MPNKCYICHRKNNGIYDLGMCKRCYLSYCRTDGAGSNRVSSMIWAANRIRKIIKKEIK